MKRITNRNSTPVDSAVVSSKIELPWRTFIRNALVDVRVRISGIVEWEILPLLCTHWTVNFNGYIYFHFCLSVCLSISAMALLYVRWSMYSLSPSQPYTSPPLLRIHTRCCPPACSQSMQFCSGRCLHECAPVHHLSTNDLLPFTGRIWWLLIILGHSSTEVTKQTKSMFLPLGFHEIERHWMCRFLPPYHHSSHQQSCKCKLHCSAAAGLLRLICENSLDFF